MFMLCEFFLVVRVFSKIVMYHWIMHLWIVKEFVFLVKMGVEGKKQWT